MAKKTTVTMTWSDLAAMDDNGMALYATPGAFAPYWASHEAFMYDECVGKVGDFANTEGFEYERDPQAWPEDERDEMIFTATIELLDPR